MSGLEYDTSQKGLNTVLRDWQIKVLQIVWSSPQGVKSSEAHQRVKTMLGEETISRASVINFLQAMRNLGVLSSVDTTGKGGHHAIYHPKLDERGFKAYIAEKLLISLSENFPEETRLTLKKLN